MIEKLSIDLKAAFPNVSGFSARNLRDTKRFYFFYNNEIWRQPVAKLEQNETSGENVVSIVKNNVEDDRFTFIEEQVTQVPWGHHLLILNKVNEPKAALFYIRQIIEHNWSRSILTIHIEQNYLRDREKRSRISKTPYRNSKHC